MTLTKFFTEANKKFNEAKKSFKEADKAQLSVRNNRDYDICEWAKYDALVQMRNQLQEMLNSVICALDTKNL